MMSDRISANELINIADMNGIRLVNVRRIHERLFVANVRRGSSETKVYVKLYSDQKSDNLSRVVEIQDQIGLPPCECLTRGTSALILEKARGRPLSQVLPIALLPGIWQLKKNSLENAFTMLGTYLGRLHSMTGDDSSRVIDEAEIDLTKKRIEVIRDEVPKCAIDDFNEFLNRLQEEYAHQCIIHTDPSPHNVFYRSGDVELIDINCSSGHSIRDNTHVELGIELMVARLPYARSNIIETLESAYWSGYSRIRDADRKLVDQYKVVAIVQLLSYYCDNPLSVVAKVTRRTDMPILKEQFRSSLNAITTDR